jgi:hypothetical protein
MTAPGPAIAAELHHVGARGRTAGDSFRNELAR